MPEWQGKSQGNTTGFRIFIFLIKTFGVRSAYFLLYFVAGYFFTFSYKSSRHILNYYKRLGFKGLKSYTMLYRNYYVFGQTLIDKIAVMANTSTKFTIDFDGEENLREMVKVGKGGLLLSGHAGNWEAAGHLLKRLNTKINIVMYDGEDEQIKNYLDSVTGEKNFNVIYVKNDLSHIYKISEALSANQIVCMHADRFRPGNKTLQCKFLGEKARFPEGPFLLTLKLKVPVAYVYSFKESATHYHFFSTEIKYFYQSQGSTMQSILEDFAQSLEGMLKRYPEQWFNYYDFWEPEQLKKSTI